METSRSKLSYLSTRFVTSSGNSNKVLQKVSYISYFFIVAVVALILICGPLVQPAKTFSSALASGTAPTVTSISPKVGPTTGGSNITITGSGFATGDTVDFGSSAATVVSISSGSIDAVAPSGVGTVDITVISGSVISSTSAADQFSYVAYTPINPVRVCDTRPASGTSVLSNQCNDGTTSNSGPLGLNQTINVNVAGSGPGGTLDNIPQNATAVIANITVTNTTQPGGFLTVFPAGQALPNTSNINFNNNETIANMMTVAIGQAGDISVYNFNGNTDVIIDIEGYVAPSSTNSTVGQYVPITPVRICDTRPASGSSVLSNQCNDGSTSNSGALSAGQSINVNVAGNAPGGILDGVPQNATAVIANITVTNTTQAGGFLTVYPSNDATPPNVSNINFNQNDTIANRVVIAVDPSTGDISIYNFNGATDVIIDINGYFTGSGSSVNGSVVNSMTPVRICDTRPANSTGVAANQCNSGTTSNNGPLTNGETYSVQVSNIDNIPQDATAVILNVTVTNTSSNGGFLTIYPTPTGTNVVPNSSDLNFGQNQSVANMVVVKVGAHNSINVFNAVGTADLIIDVEGYFTGSDLPSINSLSPSFGSVSGGTSVTINGGGFENITGVNFGSTPVSVVNSSVTSITVVSPAGSVGSVDVQVSTSLGTSALSNNDKFTYYTYQSGQQMVSGVSDVSSVNCPSSSLCFGVASVNQAVNELASNEVPTEIMSSSSGGSWTPVALPAAFVGSVSMYCSSSVCYALGTNSQKQVVLLSTTSNFAGWVADTVGNLSNSTGFVSLNCFSGTVCYADYSDGILSAPLGSTAWVVNAMPIGANGINGIMCPTSSICYAYGFANSGVGFILSSAPTSTTWAYDAVPASANGIGDIYGITCYSTTACYAYSDSSVVGGSIISTTPGSTAWSSDVMPTGKWNTLGIICPTGGVCYAYGNDLTSLGYVFSLSPGSATWTNDSLPAGGWNLTGMVCPSSSICYAYGFQTFLYTNVPSTTWSGNYVPAGTQSVAGVICPSASICYAYGNGSSAGGFVLSATTALNTWSLNTLPSGTYDFVGINCSVASICYVYGNEPNSIGSILSVGSGSTNWTSDPIQTGLSNASGTTCVSSSFCYAYGSSSSVGFVLSSASGSTGWTADNLPSGTGGILGITCVSGTICYGYGTNAFISASPGSSTWAVDTVPSGIANISDVICPSSSICYAIGYNQFSVASILSTAPGSTSWNADTIPSGTQSLNGIICPSTSICYAYGGNQLNDGLILSVSVGSQSWSADAISAGSAVVTEIDQLVCSSGVTCYAFGSLNSGGSGNFIISTSIGSSSFSSDTLPSGINNVSGIACPSNSLCYAYGEMSTGSSFIISNSPGSIIWASDAVPSGITVIDDIVCPTSSLCYMSGTDNANYQIQLFNTVPGSDQWVANTLPSNSFTGADDQVVLNCLTSSVCFAYDPVPLGNTPILMSVGGQNQWEQMQSVDFSEVNSIVAITPTEFLITGYGTNGNGISFATVSV